MPKYKYVDGVKYRVVPQSVLGYALVREGSDNSLPTGGTDGQVLTKASNADYDVEWSTVESGGGDVFIAHFTIGVDGSVSTTVTPEDIFEAAQSGKVVLAYVTSDSVGYDILPLTNYFNDPNAQSIMFGSMTVNSHNATNLEIAYQNLGYVGTWKYTYNYGVQLVVAS